jgi:FMN phosphatase YigB (HAD superfamily)
MLRAMLARERLGGPGARAVLVDDNLANLKAARSVGFAAVLVARTGRDAPGRRRLAGGGYLNARIRSVKQLPALAARLRRAPASGRRGEG